MSTAESKRVIVDFDHRDHESQYEPHARWAHLRAEAPIGFSERYGGFWVLSRYDEVCKAARDPNSFSSELQQTAIPTLPTPPFPPVNSDPPDHRDYRMIVNPFFSIAKVEQHAPWVRDRSEAYVRRLLATDHFNVAEDLGIPLTREVTLNLMGIVDPPAEINRWSDDLVFQGPTAPESGAKLMQFLLDEINDRRANPRDDFMTGLVQAEMHERPLSDDEIQRISLLVLTAGLETTNSAISGAVWYLIRNPETAQELSAGDDEVWRLAMDEFVRWTSPAPAQSRTVSKDLKFEGCPMHQNERLMLLYGSANRDPDEFADPDAVILTRRPNRHVGFGMGPHRCLGSHLAKLEMQCVLKALTPALGGWKLDDNNPVVWQGAEVRGIRSLPIVRR